jgi:hypothetical protein
LSNGFSCVENHMAVVAINDFANNFIKTHPTLPVTVAMAAGVTDRVRCGGPGHANLSHPNPKSRVAHGC